MTMDMPKNVDIAINLLQSEGFEAYAVGGCVRDSLLGKTPNDWDITTSAKPEDMKSVFADFHCIDTGIKHGTVTVVIDGEPLEITTFRLDGEYEDNRHPKSVTFTADLGADPAGVILRSTPWLTAKRPGRSIFSTVRMISRTK